MLESNELKSRISSLEAENLMLSKNNETLKDERDSEIKFLNNQCDKIKVQNTNLIAENINLKRQLKELKDDKSSLVRSNRSLRLKMDKYRQATHLSSMSAKHANTTVELFCARSKKVYPSETGLLSLLRT